MALNDEAGVVRALAIRVVGRLAGRNPAYIMPALRRHLMQLLSDMDHLPDSRHHEGAKTINRVPPCVWVNAGMIESVSMEARLAACNCH